MTESAETLHDISGFTLEDSSENDQPDDTLFEITDYLEELPEEYETIHPAIQQIQHPLQENSNQANNKNENYSNKQVLTKRDEAKNSLNMRSSSKVAFKTKSEVEILVDGYRWRKYGKKMVKNSANPSSFQLNEVHLMPSALETSLTSNLQVTPWDNSLNYYRCLSEGCNVKKRVQREQEDCRYVITTYEGIHNHPAPSHEKAN